MPRITGLKERQKALSEVNSKLKSIKSLNTFLQTPNSSNEYTVSFDGTKASIYCEDKSAIDELVKSYKKIIVEDIKDLAIKYDITLDDEDLRVMSEQFIESGTEIANNNSSAPSV